MTSSRTGQLFSELYVDKGLPGADSKRARRRIFAVFSDYARNHGAPIAELIHKGQGIDVARMGSMEVFYVWEEYFTDAQLRDVLDAITLTTRVLRARNKAYSLQWVAEVREIFRSEHLHYSVDDDGGVHFAPDEAFVRDKAFTIAALQNARYHAVRVAYTSALEEFDKTPPDGKAAVKGVFEAAEILFRLLVGNSKCTRLGTDEVGNFLQPLLAKLYAADDPAKHAASTFANALKGWVASAHFQRHGQQVEDPYQPPIDLATALVGTGANHIRWLASIDQQVNPSPGA